MENFNFKNLNIFEMIGDFRFFIIALFIIALIFYIIKKFFESDVETEFGIQNRLIGKIWLKKKPKNNRSQH